MHQTIKLKQQKSFKPIDGLKGKIVHHDNHSYVFWKIKKGTILPEHQHEHKQISIVTKGSLKLTVDGKSSILKKGMMAIIPSNAKHSAAALTHVKVLDIFDPIREDFPK